jgi:membrane protein DedA with SNARE-associated domain
MTRRECLDQNIPIWGMQAGTVCDLPAADLGWRGSDTAVVTLVVLVLWAVVRFRRRRARY